VVLVFFFFQAEDGIRDRNVTGVQTCALPISSWSSSGPHSSKGSRTSRSSVDGSRAPHPWPSSTAPAAWAKPPSGGRSRRKSRNRSEERRVGKECRSGGAL